MTYINIKTYATPEAFTTAVEDYFLYCEGEKTELKGDGDWDGEYVRDPEVPSPAGMYYHLGISKQSASDYRNKDTHEEYHDILFQADRYIEYQTINAGYGKNQSFAQFMLSRKFKYVEASKLDIGNADGAPFGIVVKKKDIKKDEDQQSGGTTVEL